MQKITFVVLLALVASSSAGLSLCGLSGKGSKKAKKDGKNKIKLEVNFGGNEVQPESVVKILEAVRGINWQQVGTSFAASGQSNPAPPANVNINGRQVSDPAALLETLNSVNWPQFSSSVASSSHGHPAGSGHSSHSTALSPGSRKINIGGRDFDVAHVAQLLEHMGDIDWRKAEKSIEAANSGTAQQSVGKNESVHLAKLLEKMGEIDWKKIESLVESSANQPIAVAASQPIEKIPEEPEHHHDRPIVHREETHSAPVPDKGKKPQSEVQRLIEKWNIPPLVEEPHFHCKENCKHCKEEIFHGEEVSAPHVTTKINRVSTVDWKTVGSK